MTEQSNGIKSEPLADSFADAVENDEITELSEDMEVIGPGQMLLQARNQLGLSQQDIGNRLNLRVILLANIEADIYDASLPETFNRGYLRAYAKLVNISVEDVLASYEMLSVAKIQCAEMQSFSNITEKEAQNSRLMWVSYLIVALLIGSTVVWWVQEQGTNKKSPSNTPSSNISPSNVLSSTALSSKVTAESKSLPSTVQRTATTSEQAVATVEIAEVGSATREKTIDTKAGLVTEESAVTEENIANEEAESPPLTPSISQATFTFSGDCWVNIYDATGERVAWGVKKAGYVMSISGKAPFQVTVGKPELAVISFNGQDVDMSKFNSGNIAKFTLPLTE
jgi:cytoskeleton protein RodZ